MKGSVVPLYREHGRTYHADNCSPLVAAARAGKLGLWAVGRGSYPGRRLAARALPGLRSAGVWDAPAAQDWGLDWHRNEGLEITCLERGGLTFTLETGASRLVPGQVTITRPWQPHRLGAPAVEPSRLIWFIVDVGVRQPHQPWAWPPWLVMARSEMRSLTDYLRQNERPAWNATPELLACFRRIDRTLASAPPADQTSRLAVYINEVLLHLLDLFRMRRPALTKSLTSARRSVELFLESLKGSLAEPWSLESMAQTCGLGVTRFVHYCREIANQTPMEYLQRLRVEAAAAALRADPGRPILEIALDHGFCSSQYFATVFARHCGCAPSAWRSRGGRRRAGRNGGRS